MKRLIILLVIALPTLTLGQTFLGIRGASGASGVSLNPKEAQMQLFGILEGGVVVKHYNLKYIGFQGELNYAQRGYRKPINDTVTYKRLNNYLELPIFMQGTFQFKKAFLVLQVGCYAAMLLTSTEGNNENGRYVLEKYSINPLRDKRFDYGLAGGGGVGYEVGDIIFQAEYRFHYGLGDLYKYSYAGNPRQSQQFVQTLSLSLLYNFSSVFKQNPASNPFQK
jgi:hypothetical protein